MALTHVTAIRNQLADLVVDAIDAGTGAGYVEIQTSGDAEVATLTFSDPAFGAASSGTATANAITDDSDATGGTAAKFRVFDSDDTEIWSGTVTATGGGGDLTLTSVAIGATDTVSITSWTYSASA